MKRKLLSLILVAAMLASMLIFVPTASAAETVVTASLSDSAAVKVGDTVEIDVVLKSDMPLYSYTLGLYYDATKLTLVKIVDNLGKGLVSDSMKNGPAYKEVLGNSPYDAFGWVQTDNTGRDISAGVAVATLVFTANEIGAAEVSLLDLQREDGFRFNEYVTTDKETFNGATALVDATTNVTVLPEGYSSESTLPEVRYLTYNDNDATFEPKEDWSAFILTKYESDFDGILVIDAVDDIPDDEYPAMPVIIGSQAFNANTKLKAIVLGEQVIEVRAAAFYKCTAADYYVLNSECVIGAGALGATGTWNTSAGWNAGRGNTVSGPYVTLIGGKAVTIHGAAGSTAEAYATATYPVSGSNTATSFQYSSDVALPTENKLTFDGNTYFFASGATTKAPGTALVDGKTVIAWTDGEKTYAPGASITVDKDIDLEPVTITAPQTATDVDFKFAEQEADLAMRFTSSMSIEDYAKLAELGDVKLGMLITPAAYVAKAGSFTKEALDALKATNGGYVDIAIDGYYKKTTTDYIFAGSLKGFSAKTLAKNPDFAAVLYATVTTDAGDVFTVYGDFNFAANQDVKTVAEGLSTSSDLTDDQKGWLTTLVGKFTPPAA